MESWKNRLACAAFVCLLVSAYLSFSEAKVVSVTFLLTVNDTWYPDEYNETCLQTVKTPPIRPNGKLNESQNIQVGKCDYGGLTFQVSGDAGHPECKILWDYQYREPTTGGANESLLPGCFVMDSREGYHMTYYWFHVLDWVLA